MRRIIPFLFLLILVGAVNAVDISGCQALTAATSYRLTADISTPLLMCFNTTGNGVTLNLDGHTVFGRNNNSFYNDSGGDDTFIVENGTVANFSRAFLQSGASTGWRIQNMTFRNLTNGASFSTWTTSRINNVTILNSTAWLFQSTSSNNNLTNSRFFNCFDISDGKCMEALGGSDNFLVDNVTVINATHIALDFSNTGTDGVIINNTNITNASTGAIRFNNLGPDGGRIFNVIISNSGIGFRNDFDSQMNISDSKVFNSTTYLSGNGMNLTNLVLGRNATTFIRWPGLVVKPSGVSIAVTEETNIFASALTFASLNDSALTFLNTTADIFLLTDAACNNRTGHYLTGFPASKASIIDEGMVQPIFASCTDGVANFTVPSFSGYTLGANFTVKLSSPSNGQTLSGTSVILSYNITTYDPLLTCNLTLDSSLVNVSVINANITQNVTQTLGSGSHIWFTTCNSTISTAGTPSWTFNLNFQTFDKLINLSNSSQNVFSAPQSLYYDWLGNLTLLYYLDKTPTDDIFIHRIVNDAIAQTFNQSFNVTKSFFIAFREDPNTWILTFNRDNTTLHYIQLNSTAMVIQNISTTYNVLNNTYYDPIAYAKTRHFPVLGNQTQSHYLFILPTTTDSRLIRRNMSVTGFNELNTTNHNRKVVWPTIADNGNLTSWFYPWLNNASCSATTDQIQIWRYNATAHFVNATPDTNCYTQTEVEKSRVFFERFENQTYVIVANLTDNTTIFNIERNRTFKFNNTISNPSQMLFVDQDTFIFFDNPVGTSIAYSCYFGSAPANCTNMTASDYGANVPYSQGAMTTSKRNGTSDIVAAGQVANNEVLQFLYSETIYDTKFLCYDEMDEFRKAFTVQIFTSNTSQILKNDSWGYVLPSDLLGSGRKRAYSECTNGTLRLFLVGLDNNFKINFYSLDIPDGQFYTFKVVDQYGQPVQNITITAQRFSNLEQAYVTIEQGVSDVTGSATLFLQTFALYQITIDAQGFVPLTFEFVPSGTTTIQIVLGSINGSVVGLPNFNRVFNDISYSILPNNASFYPSDINITYQISSSNATLEYFGMQITKRFNGTTTTEYTNNVTGSPSGGLLNFTTTGVGTYTVITWFKPQNYTEFRPTPRMFYIGNATGLAAARDLLISDAPISGWTYYFIAVCVAMVVAGFVALYTVDGAGLVGLAVLWIFSLVNPSAEIFCLAGDTACITPVIATILTTVVVAAGLFYYRS